MCMRSLQLLASAYGRNPLGDNPVRRVGTRNWRMRHQADAADAKKFDSVLSEGTKKVSELKGDVKDAREELSLSGR